MLLTVQGLEKRFAPDGAPVVQGLDFSVEPGEIFALLGPSGCGKTTTLRLIAGFERADAGTIHLDGSALVAPGQHAPAESRGIGIVFQDYALFPHLSVVENVAFGLQSLPRRERLERAQAVLKKVGLGSFTTRRPHELSGGQQQRVALARSLAPTPKLLLLDEPFSNLDAMLRQTTRHEIREVLKQSSMTAVLVTHDQEEALSFADRVAVMRNGQIEQVGTPEAIYYEPRTLFVAQFLGRTNLLWSHAHGTIAETPLGRIPLNRPAKGPVMLSMRPEHLTLDAATANEAPAPCRVVAREFKGHDITFRVAHNGAEYLVHTHNRIAFVPGDWVCIRPLEPAVVLEGQAHGAGSHEGL